MCNIHALTAALAGISIINKHISYIPLRRLTAFQCKLQRESNSPKILLHKIRRATEINPCTAAFRSVWRSCGFWCSGLNYRPHCVLTFTTSTAAKPWQTHLSRADEQHKHYWESEADLLLEQIETCFIRYWRIKLFTGRWRDVQGSIKQYGEYSHDKAWHNIFTTVLLFI